MTTQRLVFARNRDGRLDMSEERLEPFVARWRAMGLSQVHLPDELLDAARGELIRRANEIAAGSPEKFGSAALSVTRERPSLYVFASSLSARVAGVRPDLEIEERA